MREGGRIRQKEMRREKEIRGGGGEEARRDETKQCKKSRVDPPLFYNQLFPKRVNFFLEILQTLTLFHEYRGVSKKRVDF